jgi:hypothetical protein
MRFHSKELQDLFDVQVVRLFDLIDKQIQSFQEKYPSTQISHLVLSGGLGNSAYVQARLRAKYGDNMTAFNCTRNLQIHVASEPQLSVCKGIVMDRMRKLKSGKSVLGWRCCRASYGTLCKILYNPKNPGKSSDPDFRCIRKIIQCVEHFNRTVSYDPLNGRNYITQAIAWFIVKVRIPFLHGELLLNSLGRAYECRHTHFAPIYKKAYSGWPAKGVSNKYRHFTSGKRAPATFGQS